MSECLSIQSHKGVYEARFVENLWQRLRESIAGEVHYLIDTRVADLYAEELRELLASPSVLRIEAKEASKSLEAFPAYVEHLVARKLRRNHTLVAIGGGIIQDITCFLAATLLRGVDWHFFPTTLLSQADSCIGSKSSVNCGDAKNILGTFTPPKRVFISTAVLATLQEQDLRSGIGEILKAHAIDGPASFAPLAADYDQLLRDRDLLLCYVRRSLEIKKRYIEEDEFDRGPRNVFNYGHSFGHAIEAATEFAIPHGIAVTIGMDMANHVAMRFGLSKKEHFQRMHPILAANYRGYQKHTVPIERFIGAIGKDKKNLGSDSVTLILPDQEGCVAKTVCRNDENFRELCREYLEQVRCS